MKKMLSLGLVVAIASTSFAGSKEDEIKEKIEKNIPIKVEKVEKSPVKDWYQVELKNGRILYSDGKHIFVGHVFTFKGEDLTKKEEDKILAKKLDKLDLSKALKIGNGKQKVIEVSDPQCPFCRRAEKMIEGKDKNITRYIYFMPLPFHKKARPLAIHILCSKDPEKEYKKVMEGKLDKSKHLLSCEKGKEMLNEMEKQARKLSVRGRTPTFFVKGENGWKTVIGANPSLLRYLK